MKVCHGVVELRFSLLNLTLLIPESISWAVKVKITLFEVLVEIPPFILKFPVGGSKSSLMLFNFLCGYSSL